MFRLFTMKWPEWLVLGICFLLLAIFCFCAKPLGSTLGIDPDSQKYLMFGAFFGVIFLVLAIASFINLMITATREHIKKKTRA